MIPAGAGSIVAIVEPPSSSTVPPAQARSDSASSTCSVYQESSRPRCDLTRENFGSNETGDGPFRRPCQRFSLPAMSRALSPGCGVAIGKKASAVRDTLIPRSIPVKVPRAIAVSANSRGPGVRVP
jgi:hypothetical protein